jgi:chemotaxis protein methyltransferase CheR
MKFFNPPTHFRYFEDHIMPGLLSNSAINVWSAACSNGAEAYSLSLMLLDCPAKVSVVGSDNSQGKLEEALKGVYGQDEVADVPAEMLQKAFRKGVGEATGQYRIHDFLRQSVQFYGHNLINPFIVPVKFDVIFCQNVLGKVTAREKEIIENNLSRVLVSGGYLFIGPGEKLFHAKATEISPSIYQF